MYEPDPEFEILIGKTLVSITGAEVGSDDIQFVTSEGVDYHLYHERDCCESVTLTEIHGHIDDLLGTPILAASLDTNPPHTESCEDSCTWSFYTLRTVKGTVTLRWLGESNGYYSETCSFRKG